MLSAGGIVDVGRRAVRARHARATGCPRPSITLAYLWLPYMILPIYAGLERLPDSLLEASADLGAAPGRRCGASCCRWSFPAIVAGSIFTFSLSLGDYIAVKIVGGTTQMLGNVVYDNSRRGQQPAVRGRGRDRARS